MKKKLTATIAALSLIVLLSPPLFSSESDKDDPQTTEEDALREYNKGIDHMDKAKAILIKGDSAFAYNYRATSDAKAKKEYEKAIKRFNSALNHQPAMKDAYNNLGYCYRKIGKFELSLKAYRNAITLDPDFAQAREYLGETYLAIDNIEQAMEQLKYLQKLKSPLADTLTLAIAAYKLEKINSGK